MSKRSHRVTESVKKNLICLTDKAEADLQFVAGTMEVSRSEAVRMGLQLAAQHILATTEAGDPAGKQTKATV